MMASLLYYKGRTARKFTTQQASDIMCMAHAPTKGQTPANLVVGPDWGKWQPREAIPGGSAVGLVPEGKYGYLLTY